MKKIVGLLLLIAGCCMSVFAAEPDTLRPVDLGLPVLWGNADVPSSYYAWGETEPKAVYDWTSYTLCDGDKLKQKKYCIDSDYGQFDNLDRLESSDDVAQKKCGKNWRMPTETEMRELVEKCDWIWNDSLGGYDVKSKVNGNHIFLSAKGFFSKEHVFNQGRFGYYWTASLDTDDSYNAFALWFSADHVDVVNVTRCFGMKVRPVCDK